MRENHRRNHTKNTRTQKESKNKSSLPKIFRKNRPLEEENFAKKQAKDKNQTEKNTKKKNGQHFPFQQREEQAKNYATVPDPLPSERICVTIRLLPPIPSSGPCFRGLREGMGGAPTAQDGLSGALSSALLPKKSEKQS